MAMGFRREMRDETEKGSKENVRDWATRHKPKLLSE